MSKGSRRPVAALSGVAVLLAVVAVYAFLNWPKLDAYPKVPVTTVDLSACSYAKAAEATNNARKRRAEIPRSASARRLADADEEVDAAEKNQDRARECEERLHDERDLAAQWQAAIAAKNAATITESFWHWALLELGLVILSLGAAAVAVIEAQRAGDAAVDQADLSRRTLEQLERPHVSIMGVRILYQLEDGTAPDLVNIGAKVEVHLRNFGRSPALLDVLRGHLSVTQNDTVVHFDVEATRDVNRVLAANDVDTVELNWSRGYRRTEGEKIFSEKESWRGQAVCVLQYQDNLGGGGYHFLRHFRWTRRGVLEAARQTGGRVWNYEERVDAEPAAPGMLKGK